MSATFPAGIDLEVALGIGSITAGGRWDSGTWDFNSWEEADTELGNWTDVTCDVIAPLAFGAGSSADGVVTRWEAATAAFTMIGATWDPRSGPYVGLLGPGLPVRVRWRPTGAVDWLVAFVGACDDDGFTYDPKTFQAQIAATDGTRVFAAYNGVEQNSQGGGETASARVTRIADMVAWPAGSRDITAGGVTVQATTLADEAWSMLLAVADTDLALLWLTRAGALAFRPEAKVTPSTEITAVVGCSPPNVPPGVEVIDPVNITGQQPVSLRNIVSISRQAASDTDTAATVTLRDEPSISRFLAHTYQRTDLIHTDDNWSTTVAQAILMASAWPSTAPAQIELNSRADPAASALLLGLEPSLSIQVFDGIRTWTVEPAGWQVTVTPTEISGTIDLLDVTIWYGGQWDSAVWDIDQWGW